MSTVKKVTSEKVLTPSEEIINSKNILHEITDERGRSITLKQPKLVDQYKFIRVLGKDSENAVFAQIVTPLLWVKSIDDVPFSMPSSLNEIWAAVDRLDEEGIDAINEFVKKLAIELSESNEGEAKEDLKK